MRHVLKSYLEDVPRIDYLVSNHTEQNNWNISQTAREIDTPRRNLYKKLAQYSIKITAGVGEAVAPASPREQNSAYVPLQPFLFLWADINGGTRALFPRP